MRYDNKSTVMMAALAVCLLAALGVSKPGRAAVGRAVAWLGGESTPAAGSALPPQGGQDVEQRARARHGWHGGLVNTTVRGTITYYRNDLVVRQAGLTLYYKFPDRVRVEEEYQGIIQAWGVSRDGEWQARADGLSEGERRDIRAWLRVWPGRLFVARGAGGGYRELGPRVEETRPPAPGRSREREPQPLALEEVEVEDAIMPPAASPGRAPDRRAIYYLINRENFAVTAARWLEPDDPAASVDDPAAPTKEVRVDFGRWRRFAGVLLPTEVTRWVGGRADFCIDVHEVLVNQELPDTAFQDPNQ